MICIERYFFLILIWRCNEYYLLLNIEIMNILDRFVSAYQIYNSYHKTVITL